MKSNVVNLKKGSKELQEILIETEKVAVYNDLIGKDKLRLRLLTEEVLGILKELIKDFDGKFWIEGKDKSFLINFSLETDSADDEVKKKLIAVSTSGKNQLTKGFMGKIRVLMGFLAASGDCMIDSKFYGYCYNPMNPISVQNAIEPALWSLEQYKEDVKGKEEEWDELEKSIVANLADDVCVGVLGKKVTLTVKKTF